jgi:zinc transporter 1
MTISRSTRIKVLLFIDVVFFLVELIIGKYWHSHQSSSFLTGTIGYAVGSLALVADSFHMLK